MIIKERINMEELLKSLQELLAIESVARRDQEKPFGNGVAQALDYTLFLCQRMGFHTENADGLYGYAEIGEGAEIIGCLGHLDVVPAGDGWHYPPYAGTIDGGTYAKAMENIIAFGPVFPGEESREHQADEYIALDNIERLRRIYAQAFQNLLAL